MRNAPEERKMAHTTSCGVMFEILIALLIPALIAGGILFLIIRRALEFKELQENGVETTGEVIERRSVYNKTRQKKLVYRYQDSAGAAHVHTSVVETDVYEQHPEGSTLPVIYSAKRPHISVPKYLMDRTRAALAKKTS
jgi:hypothetical protein